MTILSFISQNSYLTHSNHSFDLLQKISCVHFNPILTMGLFGAAHECGGSKSSVSLLKIRYTYPTMMKLGTVIP